MQAADGIARSDAEKNEKQNAPAGAEAFVSEEDAVKEAPPWIVLRCRSGEGVTGQSGCVGLREFLVVQEISLSLDKLRRKRNRGPAPLRRKAFHWLDETCDPTVSRQIHANENIASFECSRCKSIFKPTPVPMKRSGAHASKLLARPKS